MSGALDACHARVFSSHSANPLELPVTTHRDAPLLTNVAPVLCPAPAVRVSDVLVTQPWHISRCPRRWGIQLLGVDQNG